MHSQSVATWTRPTACLGQLEPLRGYAGSAPARGGFAVLKVDNRGSSRRGLKFEGYLKYCMGTHEVDDQVAGVNYCVRELKVVDPDRVGIYGWSYGGYMSLMCLYKAPSVFKLPSGAPSYDGKGYALYRALHGMPRGQPGGLQGRLSAFACIESQYVAPEAPPHPRSTRRKCPLQAQHVSSTSSSSTSLSTT